MSRSSTTIHLWINTCHHCTDVIEYSTYHRHWSYLIKKNVNSWSEFVLHSDRTDKFFWVPFLLFHSPPGHLLYLLRFSPSLIHSPTPVANWRYQTEQCKRSEGQKKDVVQATNLKNYVFKCHTFQFLTGVNRSHSNKPFPKRVVYLGDLQGLGARPASYQFLVKVPVLSLAEVLPSN